MKELRKSLDAAISELQEAQKSYDVALAAQLEARTMTSATRTLQSAPLMEAAEAQILERAAKVETVLEAHKSAFEAAYADGMRAATTVSRGLHTQRLKLEEQLRDLEKQIEAANVNEKPAIDKLVEENGFAFEYSRYASEIARRAVSLVQRAAA